MKTSRLVPLETNATPEYKKDPEDGSHMSHLAGRLNESPSTGPDHQGVGLREELDTDVIGECKGNQGGGEDKENATNEPEGPAF